MFYIRHIPHQLSECWMSIPAHAYSERIFFTFYVFKKISCKVCMLHIYLIPVNWNNNWRESANQANPIIWSLFQRFTNALSYEPTQLTHSASAHMFLWLLHQMRWFIAGYFLLLSLSCAVRTMSLQNSLISF